MDTFIEAGERLVVVRTSFKPPKQVQAVTLEVRAGVLAIAAGTSDFQANEPVLAVVLKGEKKFIATAEIMGNPKARAWIRLTSGWEAMTRRKSRRFTTRMSGTVICLESHASQPGRVLDISRTGLRMELHVHPGEGELLVKLNWQKAVVLFPAIFVAWEDTEDGGELRVQFGELDVEQGHFLDDLIEFLSGTAKAA